MKDLSIQVSMMTHADGASHMITASAKVEENEKAADVVHRLQTFVATRDRAREIGFGGIAHVTYCEAKQVVARRVTETVGAVEQAERVIAQYEHCRAEVEAFSPL